MFHAHLATTLNPSETNVEPIDSLGAFWLPDHEDEVLTGRLRFDPAGGGTRLSLVGRFKNATEDGGEPIARILGWIESKPVTLESCFATASNHRSPGVIESSYYAN